ncbi:MAG: amino acid permease [Rhabdochlamydiaceae bacterium]
MFKGLFVKKSIKSLLQEINNKQGRLKKTLGPWQLISMGIGAIIGAGIFVLTGQAAAEYAGPAISVSFIFAAIICVFAALCYAEFASLIPVSGSAYSYAYATMGEFIAWIIGWSLTLEYLFSASTVAVGWSSYFTSLMADFGLLFPKFFAQSSFTYTVSDGFRLSGSLFNLPAVFIISLMGILVARGVKTAARFNNIMVIIKMSVVLLFILCGIAYVKAENWTPFIPENTGIFGQYGWSGVFRGAGVVFFAFIGFDALSTLSQEAKNPQKDLPKGMLGSLGISTFVYMIMGLVLTGLVSYKFLGVPSPIALAIDTLGSKFLWLRFFIKIAILAGLTSVILMMILAQARIFYTMARDGLLPKIFGQIHEKFETPFISTVIVTIIAVLIGGVMPVGLIGQLVCIGTLLAFAIVCFAVLILRYTQPLLHRPFKVPFSPWIPLFGTICSLIQMFLLPSVTWIQFLLWMGIGCMIYFGYGFSHSQMRPKTYKKKS